MLSPLDGAFLAPTAQSREAKTTKPKSTSQAEPPEPNGPALDPIIDALLDHLPAPGDYFAMDSRKKWLQLLELAFDLIYDDQPPEATDAPNGGGDV